MSTTEPVVYLKGHLVPASQAHLNIYDLGIVLGATLTEMTRTFRHKPFRLEDHVGRLYRSLKYANIRPSLSAEQMLQETLKLVEHNSKLLPMEGDLGIVHFVTPGENLIYAGSAASAGPLVPTVCIHSFPLPFAAWRHLLNDGAHVITPSIRHVPPQCLDPKTKNRSRLHWWLADQQAHATDPRAISLLLDLDGNITECAGSNFVIVKNNTIFSPTTRNILWGVSLQTVRELAEELGYRWVEKDLQEYDVINAEEAWLTTTPYCIAPAVKINNKSIGDGKIGPHFRRMIDAWSARVGVDIGVDLGPEMRVADVVGQAQPAQLREVGG
jgi:branched-chain amino acid aminotransferase